MAVLGGLSACGGNGGMNISGNTNPGQEPATDGVSGSVTFKGAPLAGVSVTLWLTNTNKIVQTAITDAGGNYSFTGLLASGNVPPTYQLWAAKTGYGFYPSVGSGGTVMRFDHTGNYQGNGVSDIAIYLTVILWTAVSGVNLAGADFAAYDGTAPLVTLAQTGQTASYAGGDDGSQAKGTPWPAARFADNGDGTVSDHLTGLVWLKNAGCFDPAVFAAALADANQLAPGLCGLSDGSKAGDWRLPNANELESLLDASASGPALPASSPFTNVSNGIYWTSTSYFGGQAGSAAAWAIRMSDGRYMNDTGNNIKATSANAVWAVKGVGGGTIKLQATGQYVTYAKGDDGSIQAGVQPTFERWVDQGNGTIVDTVTGLVWLKKADCIHADWASALAAVNALVSGQCGLTDGSAAGSWRMPNRRELLSLSDRQENNNSAFFDATYTNPDGTEFRAPIFTNYVENQYYWTSTTNAANTNEAWTVFSCDYGAYDIPKTDAGYTLAVR